MIKDNIEGKFDLVFFDAFGPDKQPEIWSKEVFEKISEITNAGGIFVTYSAKGEVRRLLRKNGFVVHCFPGLPEGEMIRATKQ